MVIAGERDRRAGWPRTAAWSTIERELAVGGGASVKATLGGLAIATRSTAGDSSSFPATSNANWELG